MAKEPKLTEEHKALLAEAEELGVSTFGLTVPNARLDTLREAIARKTAQLAKEAASTAAAERAAEEAADEEQAAIRGAFDESMGNTRGVLVRIVEWAEWLPVAAEEKFPQLTVANGVTGIEAGENEKLLTVEAMGTGRFKHVTEDGLTRRFMLYAFKATLAQNVHTTMVSTLVDAQGSNEEGEVQRPTQVAMPGDMPMPPGPNRNQRRHPNG